MKSKDYQVILSFGYLYIVILGILKEAFYYSQLSLDYFKYSSVTDILLSPLSDITESVIHLIVFIVLVVLTFTLPIWLINYKNKKWAQVLFKFDPEKETSEIQEHLSNYLILSFCVGLMGFYVGAGIGSGARTAYKIKESTLKFEDSITFVNDDRETINLIGKNTSFIFYIIEEESEIKITPTNSGILKSITEKR